MLPGFFEAIPTAKFPRFRAFGASASSRLRQGYVGPPKLYAKAARPGALRAHRWHTPPTLLRLGYFHERLHPNGRDSPPVVRRDGDAPLEDALVFSSFQRDLEHRRAARGNDALGWKGRGASARSCDSEKSQVFRPGVLHYEIKDQLLVLTDQAEIVLRGIDLHARALGRLSGEKLGGRDHPQSESEER